MTFQAACGIAAAVVSLTAGALYIRDILRGRTKPSRASWWAMSAVNLAIVASYYASGARTTVWLPLEYVLSFAFVGFLSLRRGYGSWTWLDTACIAGTLVGIAVWWVTRSAPAGLAVLIGVDLFSFIPTVTKTWDAPRTEDTGAWVGAVVASALNVLAVDDWSAAVAGYPLYALGANLLFLAMMQRRRFVVAA